jgi:hypothetical protein
MGSDPTKPSSTSSSESGASARSGFQAPGSGFTLGGQGQGGEANAEPERDESGEVLLPPAPPSLMALVSSGPMAMFSQYPLLLLAIGVTPILSSVLLLLIITSPYWCVWWYLTTPMFLAGSIGLEVGIVFLYWSRILTKNVYVQVSQNLRRTASFLFSVSRSFVNFSREKARIMMESYQNRQRARQQQKMHFGAPSQQQPRPGSPLTDDNSDNNASAMSSLTSSRRSSRDAQEGIANPSASAQSSEHSESLEEKSTTTGKKNKKKN